MLLRNDVLQRASQPCGGLQTSKPVCLLSTRRRSTDRGPLLSRGQGLAPAGAVEGVAQAVEQQSSHEVGQLWLRAAASVIPHPDKADYGGEDAYFISEVGGGALGVADGVGGWQESGINPAEYSRTFMRLAHAYVDGRPVQRVDLDTLRAEPASLQPSAAPQPLDLGNGAHDKDETCASSSAAAAPQGADGALNVASARGALAAAHEATRLPGSATALVLCLDGARRRLQAANLGDSGFMVVRDSATLFRSPTLQHYFDCPFQFGAAPEYAPATDVAADAAEFALEVRPGDCVVAATDGLWDNAFEADLLPLIPTHPSSLQKAADAMARLAAQRARDADFASPYAQEAMRQGLDLPWWEKLVGTTFKDGKLQLGTLQGGKLDDITVVVALVDFMPAPPPAPVEVQPAPEGEQPAIGGEQNAEAAAAPRVELTNTTLSSGDQGPDKVLSR